MCSSSDVLGWRTVDNTVASRMVDHSLVHTLIPCKRLRRRTKALNANLKKFPKVNSYSRYVETKTSVLRNFSEDSNTDDSDSFSDEDYTIVYKSEASLKKYATYTSRRDALFSREAPTSVDGNNVAIKTTKGKTRDKTRTSKSKGKSIRSINLGWQNVVKRRERVTRLSVSDKDKDTANRSNRYSSVSPKDQEGSSDQKSVALEKVESNSCNETALQEPDAASQVMGDIVEEEDVADLATKVQLESVVNEEREVYEYITPEPLQNEEEDTTWTLVGATGDHNDLLEEREMANHQIPLDKEQPSILSINPIDWSTPVSTKRSKNFVENLIESISTGNQPKDSGIDEDSQEDSSEDKRSVDPREDSETIVGANSQVVERSSSENFEAAESNVPTSPREENETQKHKLQPKVTHTEIVNKKYKIILGDELHDDPNSTEEGEAEERNDSLGENELESLEKSSLDSTKDSIDSKSLEETLEEESYGEHGEDSVSAFTKRRLQQLKRLNLTADGDSSSTEDEMIFPVRKGNRRSLDTSTDSSDEDDLTNIPQTVSKCTQRDTRESEESADASDDQLNDQSNEEDIETPTHCLAKNSGFVGDKMSPRGLSKVKERSRDENHNAEFSEDDGHCERDDDDNRDEYDEHDVDEDDDGGECGTRLENEWTVENDEEVADTAVRERPYNLQELIGHDELTENSIAPSIFLKDIRLEEHDAYLFDIPATILDTRLIGERITLTEKKLKIGREKYEIFNKSVDSVSFVFPTGKSCKPYKTVNVKPLAAIVAGKKIRNASVTAVRSDDDVKAPSRDKTVNIERPSKRKRSKGDYRILAGKKVERRNRKKRKPDEIQEDVGD